MAALVNLSAWLLPHHPSPYGHLSPLPTVSETNLPPYWTRINNAYDSLAIALDRYISNHPTPKRWPGLTVWLYFQRFSELITDCVYGKPSIPLVKIDACIDILSLLVLVAQSLTKLDYVQDFNPRRLRYLPDHVVRLISIVTHQLSLLPASQVSKSLRRSSKLLPQLAELTRCRGQHGPRFFPTLWNEVDSLRDMRDHKRTRARRFFRAIQKVLIAK